MLLCEAKQEGLGALASLAAQQQGQIDETCPHLLPVRRASGVLTAGRDGQQPGLRQGAVLHMQREVREGLEPRYGRGHLLEGGPKIGLRHHATGELRAAGGPRAHELPRRGDVEDGDTVAGVGLADLAEDKGVPVRVAQRTVYPDVLACAQRCLLSDLHEVAALPVSLAAGGLRVALDVALPLRQLRAEPVWVHTHDVGQREVALLAHPVHHVALAGAHGSSSEDDPRAVLPGAATHYVAHEHVLQLLALQCVTTMVVEIQGRSNVSVGPCHLPAFWRPVCHTCGEGVIVVFGCAHLQVFQLCSLDLAPIPD
mmetsp:Transcript_81568/g.253492  ORF Transcript_81568/g.253492 Transcript_81568/m.253492 type:complete len:312 (+) Transcript_81568:634-1569(+)